MRIKTCLFLAFENKRGGKQEQRQSAQRQSRTTATATAISASARQFTLDKKEIIFAILQFKIRRIGIRRDRGTLRLRLQTTLNYIQ